MQTPLCCRWGYRYDAENPCCPCICGWTSSSLSKRKKKKKKEKATVNGACGRANGACCGTSGANDEGGDEGKDDGEREGFSLYYLAPVSPCSRFAWAFVCWIWIFLFAILLGEDSPIMAFGEPMAFALCNSRFCRWVCSLACYAVPMRIAMLYSYISAAELITQRFPVTMQTSTLPIIFIASMFADVVLISCGVDLTVHPDVLGVDDTTLGFPKGRPVRIGKAVFITVAGIMACVCFVCATYIDREEQEKQEQQAQQQQQQQNSTVVHN